MTGCTCYTCLWLSSDTGACSQPPLGYSAPELVGVQQGEANTPAADVFSLGTLAVMLAALKRVITDLGYVGSNT